MYPKNCGELIKRMIELVGQEEYDSMKRPAESEFGVVLWFTAMQIAREINEQCKAKDIAEIVLNGMERLTPQLVVEWLEQQLAYASESEDDEQRTVDIEDLNERLDDAIKMHFGVGGNLLDHSKDGPDEG